MAETMRGAGRLTASLITATRRLLTASTMLHPGSVASTSTAGETDSECEAEKTRKSGCSRATSSRLTCGQDCLASTMETAPAWRNTSAIKVPLPTDISGWVQTTNKTRFG